MSTPQSSLLATWLHPNYGPEPINPRGGDNDQWSWALSVDFPHVEDALQAAGWLCGTHGENVLLVNFKLGQFALYRLLYECQRDVVEQNPNEKAEAIMRAIGQDYGPDSSRLCGAYVLISTTAPPLPTT